LDGVVPSSKPRPETGATPPAAFPDVASLGYEQARDELVGVVARLEAGADSLEESLALWERGEALAARCQEWLDGARARLAAVREPGAGSSTTVVASEARPGGPAAGADEPDDDFPGDDLEAEDDEP
jgi:exodeoxyribonuclease VII small subunit